MVDVGVWRGKNLSLVKEFDCKPHDRRCFFFQNVFLKQVWKHRFRTCFVFVLVGSFTLHVPSWSTTIRGANSQVGPPESAGKSSTWSLEIFVGGNREGLNRWEGGDFGMRWLGMLFASWFLPGGWFDDGLFLDSTPCDGEHSELYWKRCLSCGFGLVWSPLQLGNGDFSPHQQYPDWQGEHPKMKQSHGDGGYFHPLPHASCRSRPALSPGSSWYGLWGFGQRFTGQGPQGSITAYHGGMAGENWFIRSKSILFRWNSMRQVPMQVR